MIALPSIFMIIIIIDDYDYDLHGTFEYFIILFEYFEYFHDHHHHYYHYDLHEAGEASYDYTVWISKLCLLY